MIEKRSVIPDTFSRAKELALIAQFFDKDNDPHTAILYYIQASKAFINLMHNYPKIQLYSMWKREANICIVRVRQLCAQILKEEIGYKIKS